MDHGREVKDDHIELAFNGSDAHAEVIERMTGLSFLGMNRSLMQNVLPYDGRNDDPARLARQVLLSRSGITPQFMQCLPCEGVNSPVAAGNIGVKFEHGLLLINHPGDPRIGDGQQEKEPRNGAVAEVQGSHAEGEGEEDAGREDIDGPFESPFSRPHSHSKEEGSMSMSPSFIIFRICLFSFAVAPSPSSSCVSSSTDR